MGVANAEPVLIVATVDVAGQRRVISSTVVRVNTDKARLSFSFCLLSSPLIFFFSSPPSKFLAFEHSLAHAHALA